MLYETIKQMIYELCVVGTDKMATAGRCHRSFITSRDVILEQSIFFIYVEDQYRFKNNLVVVR
jgi:hypothetical protein